MLGKGNRINSYGWWERARMGGSMGRGEVDDERIQGELAKIKGHLNGSMET